MSLVATVREAVAEDAANEVKAAFVRLSEAPNHTFEWRTETVPPTPQGIGIIAGKAERDGWTQVTQTSPNGTYDIVFKRRKGLIKMPEGWKSVADLIHPRREEETRGQSPRPMRRELMLLTSGKLPVNTTAEMVGRMATFKKDGDVYSCELTPEDAARVLGVEGKKGTVIPATIFVRIRIEQGFPALMEMQQRFDEGGKMQGFNLTMRFSDIGKTKVEVPAEVMKRMDQPPSPVPGATPQIAGASLSREEALEAAQKMKEQFVQITMALFVHALGNEGKSLGGETSNDAFRVLFQNGVCEDETLFAIPDARARSTGKLPDGHLGTVDDGFARALAPGECDVTLVRPLPPTPASRNRPLLRADIKASDGTIVSIIAFAQGKPRILETRDGIVFDEMSKDTVDMFSAAAGVEPGHILRPALAGP
jgi:hypothetical protein